MSTRDPHDLADELACAQCRLRELVDQLHRLVRDHLTDPPDSEQLKLLRRRALSAAAQGQRVADLALAMQPEDLQHEL